VEPTNYRPAREPQLRWSVNLIIPLTWSKDMKRRVIFAAALLLGSLLGVPQALRAAVGPFAALAGTWSGSGTVSMADGTQERIRCRASYGVAGRGDNLRLDIRCASPSYVINLVGDVAYHGGAISGTWSETSHNAGGTISGHLNGDRIEAVAQGPGFTTSLSMATRGSHQSITIRPQGTPVTGVSMALAKS
jgi:hypothetical protein